MIARLGRLALAVALLTGCGPRPPAPRTGRELYMERCAVCHGANGEGRPGLYPPLAGSDWVNGPPERLAAIILDGIQGPLGKYNAVMPGWRAYMQDVEIAAIMTWLRKTPVTAIEVNQVRVETDARNAFWTVTDLRNLRLH